MACYEPVTAYYSRVIGSSGKRSITFSKLAAHTGVPLRLPCGKCVGCKLDKARVWTVRCMHEKQLYNASSFLTLTYSDEFLPRNGSLDKEALQLFMKRLRKAHGAGIRFFGCGEYGSRTLRPHYHVLLFNLDFDDKRFYKRTRSSEDLFTSAMASRLWTFGDVLLGNVTYASCAYVARYVTKKQSGLNHYSVMLADGTVIVKQPEFTVMSRRPGIGFNWFRQFGEHSYLFDSVIHDGRAVKPPRYYDDLYGRINPEGLEKLKFQRRTHAIASLPERTPERRRVRAAVAHGALQLKKEVL